MSAMLETHVSGGSAPGRGPRSRGPRRLGRTVRPGRTERAREPSGSPAARGCGAVRRRHASTSHPGTTAAAWSPPSATCTAPGGRVRHRPGAAGRRDGLRGVRRDRGGLRRRDARKARPIVGLWHSGGARLREGVESLHARRPRVRRDDPRLRPGAADLGRARAGRRWRRLRAGPHRRRHPVRTAASSSPAPTSSAASPARTSTWPGSAAPSRTAGAPASCTWSRPPTPRRSPRPGGVAALLGDRARVHRRGPQRADVSGTDLGACCRSRRAAPTTCTRSSTDCSTGPAWSCTPSGRRTS